MDQARKEALKTIIKRRRDVRAEFTGDPLGEEELADFPLSSRSGVTGDYVSRIAVDLRFL